MLIWPGNDCSRPVNKGTIYRRSPYDQPYPRWACRPPSQSRPFFRPLPGRLVYYNYNDETGGGVLTPGGMARLNGYRLKFDPADPAQGIFLIAANSSVTRVEIVGRNMPNELIFLTPPGLTPGQYRLEVRACFGPNHLRSGQLQELLTVI